jgi:hypothetical protein
MKEQRMQKRYDRFIHITQQVKEEVTKRNQNKKRQQEIEAVQKFQQYHKDADTVELDFLDKIVK